MRKVQGEIIYINNILCIFFELFGPNYEKKKKKHKTKNKKEQKTKKNKK
jgi:hypothetical protein